ncbi:hypothetical protein GCM10010360_64970 [Streptomyces nogalater]
MVAVALIPATQGPEGGRQDGAALFQASAAREEPTAALVAGLHDAGLLARAADGPAVVSDDMAPRPAPYRLR